MNNQCCLIGLIPLNKVESALICQCHIKLEVILLDPNINMFSIHVMNFAWEYIQGCKASVAHPLLLLKQDA